MKAYVFSIGEKTTDLCCELMNEYGFEVVRIYSDSSLWAKLSAFYNDALLFEDKQFIRIDADIIPNRNVLKLVDNAQGWTCASGFDWYSQDRKAISIHVMDRGIIKKCLEYIHEAKDLSRPETHLWRRPDINPFTYIETGYNCGLHGYGQADQRKRIQELKHVRNQTYDWALLDKIEALI